MEPTKFVAFRTLYPSDRESWVRLTRPWWGHAGLFEKKNYPYIFTWPFEVLNQPTLNDYQTTHSLGDSWC
jgi:hypothetical protein